MPTNVEISTYGGLKAGHGDNERIAITCKAFNDGNV